MMKRRQAARMWRAASGVLRWTRSPSELLALVRPDASRPRRVLNAGVASPAPQPGEAQQAVGELRVMAGALKADAYLQDGKVDYARLRGSDGYKMLQNVSFLLKNVDILSLEDDQERRALWINVYNALMVHAVVELGVKRSVMERPTIFTTVAYQVGPWTWTLDEIEHGVLRGNRPHPTTGARSFDEHDARRACVLEEVDARIHAALVCGAQSCPAIALYEAEHLDAQLDLAAEAFVQGEVRIHDAQRELELSAIFDWYEEDFGGESGVWAFILRHARAPALVERAASYHRVYAPYDWSLNAL